MQTRSPALQPIRSGPGHPEREDDAALRAGILDAVPVPVLITGADGFATEANAAWCRATGRPREASLGFGWLEAVDTSDRCRLLAAAPWVAAGRGADPAERGQPYEELHVTLAGRSTSWRLTGQGHSHVLMVALESTAATEIASWLVPDLFAIGLGLASVARLVPPPARVRILATIDHLDQINLKVRQAL